jgi:hypothetical protein
MAGVIGGCRDDAISTAHPGDGVPGKLDAAEAPPFDALACWASCSPRSWGSVRAETALLAPRIFLEMPSS